MRCTDADDTVVGQPALDQRIGSLRFPDEFIDLARAAMAEQQPPAAPFDADPLRQLAQPRLVLRARIALGVVVRDLRIVAVVGIEIDGAAIAPATADCVIGTAPQADEGRSATQLERSIAERPD